MKVAVSDAVDAAFLRGSVRPEAPFGADRTIGIVDLFSGCGGLSIGAIEGARRRGVGAEICLAVDQWRAALDVLECSLGLAEAQVLHADVSRALGVGSTPIDHSARSSLASQRGRVDLLLAGPPCQGHSALNNHTRHDDDRNELYVAMADAAELLQPTAIIIENVRGLARDRRGALEACRARLEEHYEVADDVIDIHTLGAPQRRQRHVLVASKRGRLMLDELVDRSGRDVRWAIGDLERIDGRTLFDTASVPTAENARRMKWLEQHPDEEDLPNSERPNCHRTDHSYRSMYGRLSWDRPAQTITSGFGSMGQGRFVHPDATRTLTPHEAARLQCLPDWMDFSLVDHRSDLAKMIGNAAPTLLSAALVEALISDGLL